MIAYLDSCALIYLLEGKPALAASIKVMLSSLDTPSKPLEVAVSRLTWLECRVAPMKNQDQELLNQYDAFFAQPDLLWIELSQQVVELATVIRANTGLRTPDALQAACCLQLGKDHRLLTGDGIFSRVNGLNIMPIPQVE